LQQDIEILQDAVAWRFGIIPTLSRLAAAEPVSGKNKPLVARRGIEALDVKISHCSFTSIFAPLLAAAKLLQYPTM
jgi:hypothetical protein